jgi:hypothetical protein
MTIYGGKYAAVAEFRFRSAATGGFQVLTMHLFFSSADERRACRPADLIETVCNRFSVDCDAMTMDLRYLEDDLGFEIDNSAYEPLNNFSPAVPPEASVAVRSSADASEPPLRLEPPSASSTCAIL